MIMFSFFNW